ncbi:MAG TPA: phospholipid carrier-dependent glycosyltransferase [Castellaniella sp.]|nr:phospholipid carrier-dependent glycosyltransferase [Castellaniella sp.]
MAALGALVAALAPPTDGDALCYHLELPKQFLAQHALFCPDYNDHATFPLLVEMWYVWAMALDGPAAAQLVHWLLGILLSLAAVLLCETVVRRSWAWLAGALMLLLPGITNQMTAALNDVGLAAFTTLTLAAWLRGIADEESRHWLLAAGVFLGAALAIKYTALVLAAAVAVVWLGIMVQQAGRRWFHLQSAATLLVIALAIAGPWYVRAAWHRGNPIYPFLSQHFGENGPNALPERKTPLGWNVAALASLPWQVTMHPERFGGRGHQLGPVFLLALPGLLLARRLRGLGLLLTIAALYTLLWYGLRQNIRFLYPVAPLLAAGVIWFWMELRAIQPLPRFATACVFAGVALLGCVVSLARSWDRVEVVAGWQSRSQFLHDREPTYAAAEAANRLLRPGDHILSQDYRALYFEHRLTRENVFRRATQYDQRIDQPAKLRGVLRAAGFSHVLLAEATGPGIRYNSRLSKLVAAAREQQSDAYVDLADYEFRDSDGSLRRYRLIALK